VAHTTTNITDGGNNASVYPSISADGSSVVFATSSTNLEEGVTHPSLGPVSDIALWYF
jgi:Tol biopolymer transport system component